MGPETPAGTTRERPTVPEDVEFLWRMLYYASHSNDQPGVHPGDIKSNPDLVGYIEGWKSTSHMGVIAEWGGEPVGAAWLRLLGPRDEVNPVFVDPATPELAVAVEPGHEGRGIGTKMLLALIEAASRSYPAIVLSARADSPAVKLYERLGFETVETIVNRVGTDSVKMIRRL
jgi:ribosomal protein S18 acetylase RimI-like enzyme